MLAAFFFLVVVGISWILDGGPGVLKGCLDCSLGLVSHGLLRVGRGFCFGFS